jgi:hypothetical protein
MKYIYILFKSFLSLIFFKIKLLLFDFLKNLLYLKHLDLYAMFLRLYMKSSVSTESKDLFFNQQRDINDELYGDSNFFLPISNFFSYLKDKNRIFFFSVNFYKILRKRQTSRAFFLLKYKKKKKYYSYCFKDYILSNLRVFNVFSLVKKNFFNITIKKIFLEKIKQVYLQKNLFSYIIFLLNFIKIFFKFFYSNFLYKRTKKRLVNFLEYSFNKTLDFEYQNLRTSIFNDFILAQKNFRLNFGKFDLEFIKKIFIKLNNFFFFVKKFFLFFSFFVSIFYFFNTIFILTDIVFFLLLLFIIKFFQFFFFDFIIKPFLFLILKFLNYVKLFKNFNFSFNLNFFFWKNLKSLNFLYYLKYYFFFFFINKFSKFRNYAYLELCGILFSIKKDLKRRYFSMLKQNNESFNDVDNVKLPIKNRDFSIFKQLLKKKIDYKRKKNLLRNKLTFNSSLYIQNLISKGFNNNYYDVYLDVNLMYKKNNVNYFKNLYYNQFFEKYKHNLLIWSILVKAEKSENLVNFLFRKMSYHNKFFFFKIKTIYYLLKLENLFKIRFLKLSNKFKFIKFKKTIILTKKKKIKRKKILSKKKRTILLNLFLKNNLKYLSKKKYSNLVVNKFIKIILIKSKKYKFLKFKNNKKKLFKKLKKSKLLKKKIKTFISLKIFKELNKYIKDYRFRRNFLSFNKKRKKKKNY